MTPQQVLDDPRLGQAFLQELGRQDFRYFCRKILGFAEMNREHEALCEFLQHDPAKIKLVLMPRYTFKSSIVTIGYSLWTLANHPNLRRLLYSDSTEKAEGFLAGIKHQITGTAPRSLFRTVYGPWEVDPKRGVWNQGALTVKCRTADFVEPSLETAGLETSKVGKHYDEMTFDDLVSDKNITTKDLMDKVESVYKNSLSLLTPSGHVLLAGTRWHFGDLYGRLLVELKGSKDFALFHRRAHEGDKYFFTDIGKDSLTPEFLAEKRRVQGSRVYSCLYQNDPVDDETATFKAADFRFYNPAKTDAFKQWVSSLYITCVLDAIPPPTSDHGDDAAITVVGTDAEHTMYLLEAVAGRLTPEQQIEEVLSLHAAWGFRKFGLETNAFQRMMRSELEQRISALRKNPHWTPFSVVEFSGVTQGNKEQRILGLQPWHERGAIRLPGDRLETLTGVYSKLAWQMLQFPHSQHDDLLDSLAYHLQLKQAGTVAPTPTVLPVTSAAWFEREQLKAEQLELARRPRWRRPQPAPLAFS